MSLLPVLAGIAGIWFLAVTIPGPNFIVVSRHSMSDSRKSGFLIALGVSTAASIWATSSLLSLRAVFEYATWLYDLIRIVGSLYLVYIGVKIIRSSFLSGPGDFEENHFTGSGLNAFRKGMLTSFSNPKTAAFFSSIFVTAFPPTAPSWAYLITILMVFSISLFWYGMIAVFFSIPSVRYRYIKYQKVLDRFTGILLISLGFRLAFSRS
jgi:threonine efflux protein